MDTLQLSTKDWTYLILHSAYLISDNIHQQLCVNPMDCHTCVLFAAILCYVAFLYLL